jgi:hypothetical protein
MYVAYRFTPLTAKKILTTTDLEEFKALLKECWNQEIDKARASYEKLTTFNDSTKASAMLETIAIITILRRNEDLLRYCEKQFRFCPLSRHGKDALENVGLNTIASHPLSCLWSFLLSHQIFILPEQKQTLQPLTYSALATRDD